jgi:hypothetical protein
MARRSNVAPEGLETRRRALNSQLLRSHPAIDPEETRNPVAQEGQETFSFVPRSARATGDEPRSPLVSHYSIVVVSRSASIVSLPGGEYDAPDRRPRLQLRGEKRTVSGEAGGRRPLGVADRDNDDDHPSVLCRMRSQPPHSRRGRRMQIVAPPPGGLSASMLPPWASTRLRAIASPSPLPPESAERA